MKYLIIISLLLNQIGNADASNRRIIDNHGKTIMYINRDAIRLPSGKMVYKITGMNIRTPDGKKIVSIK